MIIGAVAAMAMLAVGCSGNKSGQAGSGQDNAAATAGAVDIEGQWGIVSVVVNDSLYVHPSGTDGDMNAYISFGKGNYFIQTGCNSIQGTYSQAGDSIIMHPGVCTEMACDDMLTEDLVKMVLPGISAVDQINDSVMRLNSDSSAYIALKRANRQPE